MKNIRDKIDKVCARPVHQKLQTLLTEINGMIYHFRHWKTQYY